MASILTQLWLISIIIRRKSSRFDSYKNIFNLNFIYRKDGNVGDNRWRIGNGYIYIYYIAFKNGCSNANSNKTHNWNLLKHWKKTSCFEFIPTHFNLIQHTFRVNSIQRVLNNEFQRAVWIQNAVNIIFDHQSPHSILMSVARSE